jgi:hypothetical protein
MGDLAMAKRRLAAAGILAGITMSTFGCGLVLGITELTNDGTGGGGTGGASQSSASSATSSASTASASGSSSTTSSSTTSSSTTSSSSGGCVQMCNGSCTDTTTNDKNCGTCGHYCYGGACAGSVCQPIDLAMAQAAPTAVAVDGVDVYWANSKPSGAIMKVSVSGGTPSKVADAVSPVAIALDADNVYWATNEGANSAIWMVAKIGGSATFLCNMQAFPLGIAVSATDVFWTNAQNVMTIPKGGGSPTVFATSPGPVGIAIDAFNVYWTDVTASDVRQQGLTGGAATFKNLAGSQGTPWGIAFDSKDVYWAAGGNVVETVAINGGTPSSIATSQANPKYVAAYEPFVFWTADDGVWGYTLGGASTLLASSASTPMGIAADKPGAYWTTADGHVRFVAHP